MIAWFLIASGVPLFFILYAYIKNSPFLELRRYSNCPGAGSDGTENIQIKAGEGASADTFALGTNDVVPLDPDKWAAESGEGAINGIKCGGKGTPVDAS